MLQYITVVTHQKLWLARETRILLEVYKTENATNKLKTKQTKNPTKTTPENSHLILKSINKSNSVNNMLLETGFL